MAKTRRSGSDLRGNVIEDLTTVTTDGSDLKFHLCIELSDTLSSSQVPDAISNGLKEITNKFLLM